jgi:hypothetical protein
MRICAGSVSIIVAAILAHSSLWLFATGGCALWKDHFM